MFGLGATELLIVFGIVLLIFGGGKIAGIGRSLGTAITEFRDAMKPKEIEQQPGAPENKTEHRA